MASRVADQDEGEARPEGDADGQGGVVEHAEAADRGGGEMPRPSVSL